MNGLVGKHKKHLVCMAEFIHKSSQMAHQHLHHLSPVEKQANHNKPCTEAQLLIGQGGILFSVFEIIPCQDGFIENVSL